MNYVYEIVNVLNSKRYIGITNNPERRKKRHYTELRKGSHHSKKIQNSYDKYGEDFFHFNIIFEKDISRKELLELEKKYINIYDSYKNGYNMNEGGLENNGFHSKISKEDVFKIKASLDNLERCGGVLSEIFGVTKTTISRINNWKSHSEYKEEYESMTSDEVYEIYTDFERENNLILKKNYNRSDKDIKKKRFKKEDVFMILSSSEYGKRNKKQIADFYKVDWVTIQSIIKGKTYKNFFLEYHSFSCYERLSYFHKATSHIGFQSKNHNRKHKFDDILDCILIIKDLGETMKKCSQIMNVSINTIKRVMNKSSYSDVMDFYINMPLSEKEDRIEQLRILTES